MPNRTSPTGSELFIVDGISTVLDKVVYAEIEKKLEV